MKSYIRINPEDNVAVVISDELKRGSKVDIDGKEIVLLADVPRGHKFALSEIKEGESVVKYGYPIGHARCDIQPGEHVHSHNLATSLGDNLDYADVWAEGIGGVGQVGRVGRVGRVGLGRHTTDDAPMINAYRRGVIGKERNDNEGKESKDNEGKDGNDSEGKCFRGCERVGIRNELWILPTVGCVNGSAQAIARRLQNSLSQEDKGSIDDVIAFTHNYGCSQLGGDHANTRRALAALALHPNAGGVIVLGLGCENNRISELKDEIRLSGEKQGIPGGFDSERIRFITAQDVEDEVEAGVMAGMELFDKMRGDHREPVPFSTLKIGLKCGGSDGLSGITANPLVGRLTDMITGWGATAVLTEVPEMFGAETILMRRAESRKVFDDIVKMINDFKDYFRASGQPIYENPSPGNKEGGITTLEEKSLGCIQKGGKAIVTGVAGYAEPIVASGLNLLNAPGNDLVASTALALSGCQLVLFTTGRGTPFGTCVPTIKISTNTQLAIRKPSWIDFDAGVLLGGETKRSEKPVENSDSGKREDEVPDSLLRKIVAVADGERVRQELNGYKEIAIFKTGVTL